MNGHSEIKFLYEDIGERLKCSEVSCIHFGFQYTRNMTVENNYTLLVS